MRTRPLSSVCAVLALLALLVVPSPARAEIDLRASYPYVLTDGPGDSHYDGLFGLGVRLWMYGPGRSDQGTALGVSLDHYRLRNTVSGLRSSLSGGDRSISSSATTFNALVGYARKGGDGAGDYLLSLTTGIGIAWRGFEDIDGLVIGAAFAFDANIAFYLDEDQSKYLGPSVEIIKLTEGSSSNVGGPVLLVGGVRVGF